MSQVRVANEELRTVRDAMRELSQMLDCLERQESEKFVLTRRNQMRAVLVSVDYFAAIQDELAACRLREVA